MSISIQNIRSELSEIETQLQEIDRQLEILSQEQKQLDQKSTDSFELKQQQEAQLQKTPLAQRGDLLRKIGTQYKLLTELNVQLTKMLERQTELLSKKTTLHERKLELYKSHPEITAQIAFENTLESLKKDANIGKLSRYIDTSTITLNAKNIQEIIEVINLCKIRFPGKENMMIFHLKLMINLENNTESYFLALAQILTAIKKEINLEIIFNPKENITSENVIRLLKICDTSNVSNLCLYNNNFFEKDIKIIHEMVEQISGSKHLTSKVNFLQYYSMLQERLNSDEQKKLEYLKRLKLASSININFLNANIHSLGLSPENLLKFLQEFLSEYPQEPHNVNFISQNLPNDISAYISLHLEQYLTKETGETSIDFLNVTSLIKAPNAAENIKKNTFVQFQTVRFDLNECDENQIIIFTQYLNEVSSDFLKKLIITIQISCEKDLTLVSLFVKNINKNLTINTISLNVDEKSNFLIINLINILSNIHITELNISAHLHQLQDEKILSMAELLKTYSLEKLSILGNGFETKNLAFLVRLAKTLVTIPNLTNLYFIKFDAIKFENNSLESKKNFIELYKTLRSKTDLLFANLGFLTELFSKKEIFEFFHNLLNDEYAVSHNSTITYSLTENECYGLDYEQRLMLARSIANINKTEIPNFSIPDMLGLYPGHKMEYYLTEKSTESYDQFSHLEILNLYDLDLPGVGFLKEWKSFYKLMYSRESSESGEEFDFDNMLNLIANIIWPSIQEQSKKIWGGVPNPFYQYIIKYINDEKDKINGDIFKLQRFAALLQWYTWFSSYLAYYKISNLEVYSKVFYEIASFPELELRYPLSNMFFNVLKTKSGPAIYKALLIKEKELSLIFAEKKDSNIQHKKSDVSQNQATSNRKNKSTKSLLIPEIMLAQILLQVMEGDNHQQQAAAEVNFFTKETAELYHHSVEILGCLSNKYKASQHLKTLVSALFSIAKSSMQPAQKIQIIRNLLSPSEDFIKTEKELSELFEKERMKILQIHSKAKNLEKTNKFTFKEDLEKILGKKYFDKVIEEFSEKYFTKKYNDRKEQIEIELTKDILNALSRGILSNFKQLRKINEFQNQLSMLYLLQGLGDLNELDALSNIRQQDFKQVIYQLLQKHYKLNNEQMRLYPGAFSSQRNENCLFTYYGKIKSLRQPGILQKFQEFVSNVLTGNHQAFYAARYNARNHVHLQKVFNYFTKNNLSLELWIKDYQEKFYQFVKNNKIESKPLKLDFKTFLTHKIYQHGHLAGQNYPDLNKFLNNIENKKKSAEIKGELESKLNDLKQKEELEGQKKASKTRLRIQMELQLIKLVELGQNVQDKVIEKEAKQEIKKCLYVILKYLDLLKEGNEFKNDLKSLIRKFDTLNTKVDLELSKEWTITFTDHYWDLLLCGTEVQGSCQRVNGNPKLNQCLLAYIIDGKNKLIAIKDAAGKIIARSIIRILLDQENEQPVLFLEDFYFSTFGSIQTQTLELFAIQIAQKLNLTLVYSGSTESSEKYPNALRSISGVTLEYVDAIHQKTDGFFHIPSAQILWKAKPVLDLGGAMRAVAGQAFIPQALPEPERNQQAANPVTLDAAAAPVIFSGSLPKANSVTLDQNGDPQPSVGQVPVRAEALTERKHQ